MTMGSHAFMHRLSPTLCAHLQLMRRQVLAREMRSQLAIQVNAFGDEGRFRGQISSIESQHEEKLATLGKPAPRSHATDTSSHSRMN